MIGEDRSFYMCDRKIRREFRKKSLARLSIWDALCDLSDNGRITVKTTFRILAKECSVSTSQAQRIIKEFNDIGLIEYIPGDKTSGHSIIRVLLKPESEM